MFGETGETFKRLERRERNVIDWRSIGETFERGKMLFAVTPLL
jgi:hypothetical protein